jgi:hypothetical protein
MTNNSPAVHIYTLSRLVHAPAAEWERKINAMESGRERAYAYYQPMREAIVRYCAESGKGREKIVERMLADARQLSCANGQNPAEDNLAAFETFESAFYPKLGKYIGNYLRSKQNGGTPFEGIRLGGLPHLKVQDDEGRERFVFLYPSNWRNDELKAYLELLSVVLEVNFGASGDHIWCMNLRTGKTHRYRPGIRERESCVRAAQHYARVFSN